MDLGDFPFGISVARTVRCDPCPGAGAFQSRDGEAVQLGISHTVDAGERQSEADNGTFTHKPFSPCCFCVARCLILVGSWCLT